MIDTNRYIDRKYDWLLDQLQILEYIETNKRPLTPRERKMQRDYRKQAEAIKVEASKEENSRLIDMQKVMKDTISHIMPD